MLKNFNISDTYATIIADKGVNNVIKQYLDEKDKKMVKTFMKTHLIVAAKTRDERLISDFYHILMDHECQWSHRDVYDITHFKDPESQIFGKTCLNYTNENHDMRNAFLLLKIEDYVHNRSTYSVFSCLQQNLNSEQLVPWLKETYEKHIKHGTIPELDLDKQDTRQKNFLLGLRVFTEIGVLSVIPVSLDFTSDVELYHDYNEIRQNLTFDGSNVWQCNNSYVSPLYMAGNHTSAETAEDFSIASSITLVMILMNVLVYLLGLKMGSPVWLNRWRHAWDERNKQYEHFNMSRADFDKENKDLYSNFKMKYKAAIFAYYLMLGLSYMLWPIFILMPNRYMYMHSKRASDFRDVNAKSSTAWRYVKIAENGVENVLQIVLQVWLLNPIFASLSKVPASTLLSHIMEGLKNLLSFGLYETCLLDKTLGKLVYTSIICSLSLALFKVDRPGLGIRYKLKAVPGIFLHLLIQIMARIYALRFLMMLKVKEPLKYGIVFAIHAAIVIPMKVITETQKDTQGLVTFLQRLILCVISAISSVVIMIDWHWNTSHLQPPKFMFFSRILFQLLNLVENLAMVCIPLILPHRFSKDDLSLSQPMQDVLVVAGMWVVSVSFKVVL